MKILIVPDKFKYTFSASEIAFLIKEILLQINPKLEIEQLPLSDGGEGFLSVFEKLKGCKKISSTTYDACYEQIKTNFLFNSETKTAFLELAQTVGLQKIKPAQRNPMKTSSYGLGVQILQAVELGATKIIIGLGGSATNDAGIGLANALGYRFLGEKNQKIETVGKNLIEIRKIYEGNLKIDFSKIKILALTDVNNVLSGKNGAAYIYAKQKGASESDIFLLDEGLQNINKIFIQNSKTDYNKVAGAGAAGGIGAGLVYFCKAKIQNGSQYIFKTLNLENKIKNADLIITGEGKLDIQSFEGKLVSNVVELAKKHNKKVLIVCGVSELPEIYLKKYKNLYVLPIYETTPDLKFAKKEMPYLLQKKLSNFYQLYGLPK